MAHAYVESLKSSDLSRQVGAIILNDDGNILASGCNEVPKCGGGLHWCDTEPNFRDFNFTDKNHVPISENIKSAKQKEIADKYDTEAVHLSHSTPLSYYWIETLYLSKLYNEFKEELRSDFKDTLLMLLENELQKTFYDALLEKLGNNEIISPKTTTK